MSLHPTKETVRRLHLPLKAEYFDAIKRGEKLEEYRLHNAYWCRRLIAKEFDEIVLTKGYPSKTEHSRRLRRPWRGYQVKRITHPHFGEAEVTVFAIRVNP